MVDPEFVGAVEFCLCSLPDAAAKLSPSLVKRLKKHRSKQPCSFLLDPQEEHWSDFVDSLLDWAQSVVPS